MRSNSYLQSVIVAILSLASTVLFPLSLSLPYILYNSKNWGKSTLIICLITGAFLVDILGNIPFGSTLVGYSSIMLIFYLLNDLFKIQKIQILVMLFISPLLWEVITKIYLVLLS